MHLCASPEVSLALQWGQTEHDWNSFFCQRPCSGEESIWVPELIFYCLDSHLEEIKLRVEYHLLIWTSGDKKHLEFRFSFFSLHLEYLVAHNEVSWRQEPSPNISFVISLHLIHRAWIYFYTVSLMYLHLFKRFVSLKGRTIGEVRSKGEIVLPSASSFHKCPQQPGLALTAARSLAFHSGFPHGRQGFKY